MKKLRVMTIVGTRPEIIRLACVIAELERQTDHYLIHTGQNYDFELSEIFFKDLSIQQPIEFLNAAGKNANETIGKIIIATDDILEKYKPEALLILGDTNSCLSAIAAKRKKIPIFHMEAGNRCFDFRVPEEINRRLVDHLADINLTYSTISRDYLIREGLPPDLIIKVGSPMYEVINYYKDKINKSDIVGKMGLINREYFVFSAHREENITNIHNLRKILDILNEISSVYNKPIVFTVHPRTRKMIESIEAKISNCVKMIKPLGFTDYVNLQSNAFIVISDSGTISEEASVLGFDAINLREAHERPEAMEEATTILTGLNKDRVMQAINYYNSNINNASTRNYIVEDYNVPNVSRKVVKLILSYTDYVKRVVWKEY